MAVLQKNPNSPKIPFFARGKSSWKLDENEKINFHKNVLGRIKEQELDVLSVSKMIGLSDISRYIKGLRDPSENLVKNLADVFSTSVESLFQHDPRYANIPIIVNAAQKKKFKASDLAKSTKVKMTAQMQRILDFMNTRKKHPFHISDLTKGIGCKAKQSLAQSLKRLLGMREILTTGSRATLRYHLPAIPKEDDFEADLQQIPEAPEDLRKELARSYNQVIQNAATETPKDPQRTADPLSDLLRLYGTSHDVPALVQLAADDTCLAKIGNVLDYFLSTIKKFSKIRVEDVPQEVRKQIIHDFLEKAKKSY